MEGWGANRRGQGSRKARCHISQPRVSMSQLHQGARLRLLNETNHKCATKRRTEDVGGQKVLTPTWATVSQAVASSSLGWMP